MRNISITLISGLLILIFSCRQKDKLQLLSYSKKNLCDKVCCDYPTKLIKKDVKNGILILSINVLANCTDDYYGIIKIDPDTLRLFYIPKGLFPEQFRNGYLIQEGYEPETKKEVTTTFCECYLEMTYKISGITNLPGVMKINANVVKQ